MKPVICFFENEKYLYSTNYQLLECPENKSVTEFLQSIEEKYSDAMKVVQVNFDSNEKATLYKNAKAAVFILNNYEHISLETKAENLQASFELMISKNKFINDVKLIKKMIGEGRFYQVNLTTAFQAKLNQDGYEFFKKHHANYAGAYKCFLPLTNCNLISFSPELFLEKKSSLLKTQPIKGSVSNTQDVEADLMKSEKENAELSMIVDLLRNDLNSLEEKQSAQVVQHRQVMNLNYIQHTYSDIQIQTEKHLPFILDKMLPGGSISGCPKKESLKAINELETYSRSAYTGCMGWWKNNEFKLNIAIRTFVQSGENYFYFAGCGIVYDSDPEKEFEELLNKAGRLNVRYQ